MKKNDTIDTMRIKLQMDRFLDEALIGFIRAQGCDQARRFVALQLLENDIKSWKNDLDKHKLTGDDRIRINKTLELERKV